MFGSRSIALVVSAMVAVGVVAGCGSEPDTQTAPVFGGQTGGQAQVDTEGPRAPTTTSRPRTTLINSPECSAYLGFANVSTYTMLNKQEDRGAMIPPLKQTAEAYKNAVPDMAAHVDTIVRLQEASVAAKLDDAQLAEFSEASGAIQTWKAETCQ